MYGMGRPGCYQNRARETIFKPAPFTTGASGDERQRADELKAAMAALASAHYYRRHTVVPRVTAAKAHGTKVSHRCTQFLTSASEVSIIEDHHAGSAE